MSSFEPENLWRSSLLLSLYCIVILPASFFSSFFFNPHSFTVWLLSYYSTKLVFLRVKECNGVDSRDQWNTFILHYLLFTVWKWVDGGYILCNLWCYEQLTVRVIGWSLVGDDTSCLVIMRISNWRNMRLGRIVFDMICNEL